MKYIRHWFATNTPPKDPKEWTGDNWLGIVIIGFVALGLLGYYYGFFDDKPTATQPQSFQSSASGTNVPIPTSGSYLDQLRSKNATARANPTNIASNATADAIGTQFGCRDSRVSARYLPMPTTKSPAPTCTPERIAATINASATGTEIILIVAALLFIGVVGITSVGILMYVLRERNILRGSWKSSFGQLMVLGFIAIIGVWIYSIISSKISILPDWGNIATVTMVAGLIVFSYKIRQRNPAEKSQGSKRKQ